MQVTCIKCGQFGLVDKLVDNWLCPDCQPKPVKLKKYKVAVSRLYIHTGEIDIEAEDEEKAIQKVLDMIDDIPLEDTGDYESGSEVVDIIGELK